MDAQLVIAPSAKGSQFLPLARSPKGRLFRKQILKKGPLRHPSTGETIDVDDMFLSTIVDNFNAKICDIVQMPLANDRNEHTEDPTANIGEVVGLNHESDGLWAVVDVRKHAEDIGSTILGASAFLHLDYLDSRTGKKVGPTLLHVAATNRPYVTDLQEFEELIAASADQQGEVVLLTTAVEEESSMDLDEIKKLLKSDFEIDLDALLEAANTDTDKTAETELSASIVKALDEAGILKLTAGQESEPEDVAAAVKELALSNKTLQDEVSGLKLSQHTREVDDLIREGRVLPAQRGAMIKLSMTDPETFKALVPESPIVKLSNERGTSSKDDDVASGFESAEDLEKEFARLTAANPDYFTQEGK